MFKQSLFAGALLANASTAFANTQELTAKMPESTAPQPVIHARWIAPATKFEEYRIDFTEFSPSNDADKLCVRATLGGRINVDTSDMQCVKAQPVSSNSKGVIDAKYTLGGSTLYYEFSLVSDANISCVMAVGWHGNIEMQCSAAERSPQPANM